MRLGDAPEPGEVLVEQESSYPEEQNQRDAERRAARRVEDRRSDKLERDRKRARQRAQAYRAYHWLDDLDPDERELWLAVRRASYTAIGSHHDSRPGGWIPYGRVPIELIPDEDGLVSIGRFNVREENL